MGEHWHKCGRVTNCPRRQYRMICRTPSKRSLWQTDPGEKELELGDSPEEAAHYASRDGAAAFRNGDRHAYGGAGDHWRMAIRYGDDQIASVLTTRLFTGKGMRVESDSRGDGQAHHSIAGQKSEPCLIPRELV